MTPLPSADDPAFARRLLGAIPAGVFVIDAGGAVRSVNDRAAAMVEADAASLIGRSVLDFVDSATAWIYAAAVAMATDYPDVIMGPLRITFVTTAGTLRFADLWASNHLNDPDIGGIVCLVTEETAAAAIVDAVSSVAAGDAIATVASLVANAMRAHPVVADAFVVVAHEEHDGYECITPTSLAADLVRVIDDDAAGAEPWRAAINGGTRVIHEDLSRLPSVLHEAAERDGYAACWVEPVPGPSGEPAAALVLWRHRTGAPSPNQLHSIHQAAAILAVAFASHR